MAIMCDNGIYREMTEEEIATLDNEKPNALTEMVEAMSNATTLAQMRNACKTFLEKTEVQNG